MDETMYSVYVKTDGKGRITDIKSNPFIKDFSGWIKIDEGADRIKYYHAQGNYLDGGVITDNGIPRYKLVDGAPVLRSEEEIAADSQPDLGMLRDAKQAANKKALADWLAAHPLTWTDGNVYGVTEQDQNEMNLNFAQYQIAVMSGEENPILEWHTQKKRCHTFTREEFIALARAITAYVYPYRRYLEAVKEDIYMAETKEELDAITIDYGSVGAAA